MMREALKLAALHALRGVLLKFVLPVVVVIVLVGGLIGGIVAAIFGGTGTAAAAGDCTISGGTALTSATFATRDVPCRPT